ncbi:Potassium-transporting ATPase B chain [Nitrosotalea devaniterrae]|uniref:Potassium-transporting ATPase ATP-binding subunit n=1 Tax=Nitrosotalea devaniterrae TaxID=1078905 RepID=A0A128A4E3_9ARCH|nr:Potassium-transporting ATPase B chain [Candidatus Nitrosotalea devanaterra]
MASKLLQTIFDKRMLKDSVTKLSPLYLAKKSPVMFTVEVGFFLVLAIGLLPTMSTEFVNENRVFYIESAVILIVTVWFATFSESLSESQARAKVDSLKNLEKEVMAKKLVDGKEISVKSTSLLVGDRVRVYAGEIVPRDGIVHSGKAFVDESMMTGESNPVFKEQDSPVMGGTKVANDSIVIEITSEAGKSFLDEMVGLIESAKRPKTKNEIALTILLAGLSLIFVTVVGTMLFFGYYLGYHMDISVLIALLVALLPTTIGGLLPAIGVAGINRLARDNIVVKSGKGIEAAGDCDVLILDKTGTITEGARRAIGFIPMEKFTEQDIGEASYAASFSDHTHEGTSIIELANEKKIEPPFMMEIMTARPVEFSSETRCSGIEFSQKKNLSGTQTPTLKTSLPRTRVCAKVEGLEESNIPVKILKGSVEAILKIATNVNEPELRWKAQEISKNGGTPLAVAINDEIIGLISLKDTLKKEIRTKLDEVRVSGITTVMITGDNQLTAQVIAKEANIDQIIAEAKPSDKLNRVVEEQLKGHVVGMIGDGTNDAPALAKADVGLAMNRGTAAAREAANMVDLDSDPSKILKVVKLGKQLLMTRGAITTFSIANDVAKYFAILPAMFMKDNPKMEILNVMQLHSPESAVLSTLIFNAIVIPILIPLSLKGVKYKPELPEKTFIKNMMIYGFGGVVFPFAGIKAIDLLLSVFMR